MQIVPSQSGVYVVEMLNVDPISVNADRPKVSDRCIKVNRENCKYGKAKNLARRRLDYVRTFGESNFVFRFVAVTDHFAAVEAEVGLRLALHRVPGQTGRPNEWLQGISALDVERVVRDVLASVPHGTQANRDQATRRVAAREMSASSTRPFGVSPTQLIEAAKYLFDAGMSVEHLREMHHSPRRDETFKATLRYFAEKSDLLMNNVLYGARLIYVAEEHRKGRTRFPELVDEALQRYPK
jgi:hypothetical protein